MKKYGLDVVLAPALADLQTLETTGIEVNYKNTTYTFHGTIFIVISDNLAAHSLSGFQENFSTTKRICRICMCTREEMHTITHNKDCHLRTVQSFKNHLEAVKINPELQKEYGVKNDCPLNTPEHFHCMTGMPFDAAHDFMEGVIPYILTAVVKKLVGALYFSLEDLNDFIEHFEYARLDKNDMPQPFTIPSGLNNFQIKLTAAECLTFVRLFPLMVGHLIPEDDRIWEIVIILLDYLELLMAFEFYPGTTQRMDNILELLLETIKKEMPEFVLKPKFHFALHYGYQTRLFGPPRTRYTLRYESKHLAIKKPLNVSKNRKNICLTLANRHQSQLLLRYKSETFFPTTDYSPVGLSRVHLKTLLFDYQQLLQPLLGDTDIIQTSHGIKLSDGSFYENDIVLYSIDGGKNHVLLKISKFVYCEGEPFVFCDECDIVTYNMHLHAYEINILENMCKLLKISHLKTNHVLGSYDISNKLYVPLKFEVVNIMS